MTSPSRVSDVQMPPQGMERGRDFIYDVDPLEVGPDRLEIGDPVTNRAWGNGKIAGLYGNFAKVDFYFYGKRITVCVLKWRLKKI